MIVQSIILRKKNMTLLLFQETKEEILERELKEARKEITNVRKGLFARHSELEKKYQSLFFEFETLKESIAKQEKSIWTSKSSSSIPSKKTEIHSPDLFTYTSSISN